MIKEDLSWFDYRYAKKEAGESTQGEHCCKEAREAILSKPVTLL
jgi:hypothetical protein